MWNYQVNDVNDTLRMQVSSLLQVQYTQEAYTTPQALSVPWTFL